MFQQPVGRITCPVPWLFIAAIFAVFLPSLAAAQDYVVRITPTRSMVLVRPGDPHTRQLDVFACATFNQDVQWAEARVYFSDSTREVVMIKPYRDGPVRSWCGEFRSVLQRVLSGWDDMVELDLSQCRLGRQASAHLRVRWDASAWCPSSPL